MSTPSDEILIQRKLRAAEIALETARRRRFERDEEVRALQSQIADLEAALEAAAAGREHDRVAAEARVDAARTAQREAEQRLIGERHRRLGLEQELSALRAAQARRDILTRQLEAERRARGLEAEVELIRRRAAEFEHEMRAAALEALRTVAELSEQTGALISMLGLEHGDVVPAHPVRDPRRPGEGDGGGTAPGRAGRSSRQPAGDTPRGLDDGRLDAALERLRAASPGPDPAD